MIKNVTDLSLEISALKFPRYIEKCSMHARQPIKSAIFHLFVTNIFLSRDLLVHLDSLALLESQLLLYVAEIEYTSKSFFY